MVPETVDEGKGVPVFFNERVLFAVLVEVLLFDEDRLNELVLVEVRVLLVELVIVLLAFADIVKVGVAVVVFETGPDLVLVTEAVDVLEDVVVELPVFVFIIVLVSLLVLEKEGLAEDVFDDCLE